MRTSTLLTSLLASATFVFAQIPRTTGGSLTIPASFTSFTAAPIPSDVTGIQYCSAQGLGLPGCALECILDQVGKIGCGPVDFPCQCNVFTADIGYAEQCVVTSCGLALGLIVQSSVSEVCDCFAKYPSALATASPSLGFFTVGTEVETISGAAVTSYIVSTAQSVLPIETGYFGAGQSNLIPVGGVFGAMLGAAAAAL